MSETEFDVTEPVTIAGKEFTFRTPDQEAFEDYQEKVSGNKSRKGVAARELCQRSLHAGGLEELKKAFERKPGAAVRIVDTLCEMSGTDLEVTVKKG